MDSKINFDPNDSTVKKAIEITIKRKKFSTAFLQTYLGKGHSYVTSMADWLEEIGAIGPENGGKPRDVLVSSMDEVVARANGKLPKKSQATKQKAAQGTIGETKTNKGRAWVWAVAIIAIIVLGVIGKSMKDSSKDNQPSGPETETVDEQIEDFTGQDAKRASSILTIKGYDVTYIFDRVNNGGFTDEQFQKFVDESFNSESYDELPFVVTGQSVLDKKVVLTIEYKSSVEQNKAQQQREAQLEEKLSIVTAMSACELYGKRNYKDFKLHSIVGRIAEYATDNDTWFLKYTADANGYKGLNMECYVTGTNSAPTIKSFKLY